MDTTTAQPDPTVEQLRLYAEKRHRVAMSNFGAEYGIRVVPFRETIRVNMELFGCAALEVLAQLRKQEIVPLIGSTEFILLCAAAYDEHRIAEKRARK